MAPPGVLVGVVVFHRGELDQREKKCSLLKKKRHMGNINEQYTHQLTVNTD